MNTTKKGFTWRSQSAFVIVAAGATLSLNDFLTFPVLVGQNGGGAFLLLYILFLFLMGLPLLMGELMLGRLTRSDPAASLRILSEQYKASVCWKLVGLGAMLAAFLIIATLSVVAGWSLAYSVKSVVGVFEGVTLESARLMFESLMIDSERMTPLAYVIHGHINLDLRSTCQIRHRTCHAGSGSADDSVDGDRTHSRTDIIEHAGQYSLRTLCGFFPLWMHGPRS